MRSVIEASIADTFDNYPKHLRAPLLSLRDLVFEVASTTEGVGDLLETLKWGQPSYLTANTGAGSTVRLGPFGEDKVALYFHCQTSLVANFREIFPYLEFSKNRAIVIDPRHDIPLRELRECVEIALTCKLRKKKNVLPHASSTRGKDA